MSSLYHNNRAIPWIAFLYTCFHLSVSFSFFPLSTWYFIIWFCTEILLSHSPNLCRWEETGIQSSPQSLWGRMGTAYPSPPPHTGNVKKNREKTSCALPLWVYLILLADFVDSWNPMILDLADLFITVNYSAFICLSGSLRNPPLFCLVL